MSDMVWRAARPARVPSWTSEQFDDGVVLHDPETGRIVELDGPGAAVWGLCDGARSGAEIVAMLAAAFPDAPADAIAADVADTLERLLAVEVLRVA